MLRCTMYLPLLWCLSGAPMRRCTIVAVALVLKRSHGATSTICCRCFGLEVVPQSYDVRLNAVDLVSKLCPSAEM